MRKNLYRSKTNSMLGGVAAGIADYFTVDPALIRIVWALLFFVNGAGLWLYIIAWIVIPPEPSGYGSVTFERGEQVRQQIIDTAKDLEDRMRTGSTRHEAYSSDDEKARRQTLGWILVALGAFFLIRPLFAWLSFEYVWPLLLVGVGAFLVLQGLRR